MKLVLGHMTLLVVVVMIMVLITAGDLGGVGLRHVTSTVALCFPSKAVAAFGLPS